MESKRRSAPKSAGAKPHSSSKGKDKRGSSPASKEHGKKKDTADNGKQIIAQLVKKPAQQLLKKKIEDLKPPEILIKVNYKNKRISIPIAHADDKCLNDTVMPHIVRFEHEVLRISVPIQATQTSPQQPSATGRLPDEEMSSRTTTSKLANPSASFVISCSRSSPSGGRKKQTTFGSRTSKSSNASALVVFPGCF